MDASGRFYVAYTREDALDETDDDVLVARFSASGVIQGITYVATSDKPEYDPSIACSRYGTFVVTYTRDFSSTDQDVEADTYDSPW